MTISYADHLVLTAPTLALGMAYIEQTLGIVPQTGGEHIRMGTHNALVKLGRGFYLEVIAINPAAPAPPRPRWFGLDTMAANARPHLATWVVRTDDIAAAVAAAPGPTGTVQAMSRGDLSWQITIPDDGALVLDGIMPALIEWHTANHPSEQMQDLGCSLVSLEGFHAQAPIITRSLEAIGMENPVPMHTIAADQAPHLLVLIQTPTGVHPLGLRQ